MPRKQAESRQPIDYAVRMRIYINQKNICPHCGRRMEFHKDFTIEHVIPISKGGTNDEKNLIGLCRECNKAKSNHIIAPIEYYWHLDENRRKELQALFDQYINGEDWLSYDNLFQQDMFRLTVYLGVMTGPNKAVPVPYTIEVDRVRPENAMAWLTSYTARLRTEDKAVMAHDEKALTTPYYRVHHGDVDLMYFTAYIKPVQWLDPKDGVTEVANENCVVLNVFTNPKLELRRYETHKVIGITFGAVMNEIQRSIMARTEAQHTAMRCNLEFPASDRYGDRMLEYVNALNGATFTPGVHLEDGIPDERIHSYSTILLQSKSKTMTREMREISDRLNQSVEEQQSLINELQKPIDKRLEEADALRSQEKKTRTKSDKKRPSESRKRVTEMKQKHRKNGKKFRRKK